MAAKKMGLGRGLNVLIPDQKKEDKDPVVAKPKEKIKEVIKEVEVVKEVEVIKEVEVVKEVEKEITLKLSEIEPNRNQPRKQFDEDGLEELAESIKQFGIIQPLVVQKKDDYYEIIAGERRWRAARMAGLKKVPVIIRDFEEQKVLEVALIENIQRQNLNPMEEAKAYERLNQEFNLTQDDIAKKVSKSRVTITNTMRLLKLDERVQKMVEEELISSGHARCLLSLTDKNNQYEAAMQILDLGLSVRQAESLVKRMANPPKREEKNPNQYDYLYKELEESMKQRFGTKVHINEKKNNKGKIEIEYYSHEDLERIIDMLQSL